MSILLMCACGHHFEASETHAGDRLQCPDCGYTLIVPKADPFPEFASPPPGKRPTASPLKSIMRIALGVIGGLFLLALLLPGHRSARGAARRAQCVNDLKQIGLGLYNYHSTYECLPPAAITDKNGRPLLSWRVAILPYIECSPLYSKFHLDEPWDSPHNRALLEPMPLVYACPSDEALKPGMTNYQAVIGPATAFTPDFVPTHFPDFTDGLGKTFLIGESLQGVPWTKPEDLPEDRTVPLNHLGSHHSGGFNALFGDGSVKFLKLTISPQAFGALLTRNGGEEISADSY